MNQEKRWIMPEGVEELLPLHAEHLEHLRRRVLDLFHQWGYQMVVTPMIEYVESLLLGRGDELDLQTYKLTDQLNGRLLGVRADITPQVARIDAHHLANRGPTRLCYVGQVLHTRPHGFSGTREPIQLGAELYGHAGHEADVEVIQLMVATLDAVGLQNVHLDFGHVGIFRGLAAAAQLSTEQELALFEAIQRKAKADMAEVLSGSLLGEQWRSRFLALADWHGDEPVLAAAQAALANIDPQVDRALAELRHVADAVKRRIPALPLHFDLAELRGYQYKTGLVFAAFVPGHGQEVARGGRYDEIGREYGRARPATGFSTDLKTLIRVSQAEPINTRAIAVPYSDDLALSQMVRQLREQGERVIVVFPDQLGDLRELGCDREIVSEKGRWNVRLLGDG